MSDTPSPSQEVTRRDGGAPRSGVGADGEPAGPLRPKIGRFTILGELGRGGYGVVYRALDDVLGRPIALKLLRDDPAGGTPASDPSPASSTSSGGAAAARDRLIREARSVARLGKHPHVVQVHEAGEAPDGQVYVCMELVEGEPLERIAARRGFDWREATEIGRKVALGLEHAHRHGVIHRDVKPANVILDVRGEPHLTDFGVAKDLESGSASITRTGSAVGTPAYMSPEQAEGLAVDARSDVYGLGALLYALVAGRPPFVAPHVAMILAMVMEHEPPRLRNRRNRCPRDLETVVGKAMEKDPARRYASASEMGEDLQRILDGEPIAARRPGPLEQLVRHFQRHPRNLVLVLAIVAAGFITYRYREADEERAALQTEDAVRLRLTQLGAVGALEEKLRLCDDVVRDFPGSWQAHFERGLIERELALAAAATDTPTALARYREADRSLGLAIERNASALYARFWRGVVRCEGVGEYEGGDADLAEVVSSAQGDGLLSDLAACLRAGAASDGELRGLDATIAKQPRLALLREKRAEVRIAREEYAEALADAEAAAALAPFSGRAHAFRAMALAGLERFAESAAAGERAVALAPRFPDAYEARAVGRMGLGRLEDALADAERAIALGGPDPAVRAAEEHLRAQIEAAIRERAAARAATPSATPRDTPPR